MSELNNREQCLVAMGAALASNCVPCMEYHIPRARRVGLSDAEITAAIRIAEKVRQVPARAVLEAAEARLETTPDEFRETDRSQCGCGGSDPVTEAGGVS